MVHGAYDAASQGDFVLLESGRVLKGTFLVDDNYNLEENASATEETTASIIELNDRIDRMATEAARLKELAEKLEGKIKVFKL